MTAARRHRSLRPRCDCDSCSAKRSEWDRAQERAKQRVRATRVRSKPQEPESKPEPLLWSREERRGVRPHVYGRTEVPTPTPIHVLYRFFNDAGHLLYVGITNSPVARIKGHQKISTWFMYAALATFEHFPDRASLLDAEREAIQTEHPRHNNLHADGRELLPRAPRARSSPRQPKITRAELQQGVLDLGI